MRNVWRKNAEKDLTFDLVCDHTNDFLARIVVRGGEHDQIKLFLVQSQKKL